MKEHEINMPKPVKPRPVNPPKPIKPPKPVKPPKSAAVFK